MLLLVSAGSLPWVAAFTLQTYAGGKAPNISAISVGLDSGRSWSARIHRSENDQVIADIPIEVDGTPAGAEIRPVGASLSVIAPHGEAIRVKASPQESIEYDGGAVTLEIALAKSWYERHRQERLRVHGVLYLALYEKPQYSAIPLNGGKASVPGVGSCSANDRTLLCESSFRRPASFAEIVVTEQSARGPLHETEQLSGSGSSCPFPAELNIDPVFRWFSRRLFPMKSVVISSSQPIGYARKAFKLDAVTLSDYKLQD